MLAAPAPDALEQAFALLDCGDYAAARDAFARRILDAPQDARAWYGRGRALLGLDEAPAAVEALEMAVRLDAGYRRAVELLSVVRAERGDWQGVVAERAALREGLAGERITKDEIAAWRRKGR